MSAGANAAGGLRVDPALREAVAGRVLLDDTVAAAPGDRSQLRVAVARALAALGVVVPPRRWAQMVRDLVDELGGLGPLEGLLRDPTVTDVMVNTPREVWVDRGGRLEQVPVVFDDDDHLLAVLARVLGPLGVRLDRAHPWADAMLPDGVRLHALLPPLAPHPTLTLRRVPPVVPSWDELAAWGSVPSEAAAILRAAVADRRNIVVCGRAGAGKTTLLSRLLAEVGDDRVIVIEDAPELAAGCAHLLTLRVRPPSPDGAGGVDVATLVRNALRMRPDRLIVGEVRGHEVADVLQAMNTGHEGALLSVHANGAADALVRLEGMALLSGVPLAAARAQVSTAVHVVVGLERRSGGLRCASEIVAVHPGASGPECRSLWRAES